MFICPIDIPPVPIQEMDTSGALLPSTGEFCGENYQGVPVKCVCTAQEHLDHVPLYHDYTIPVIPYFAPDIPTTP